MNLESLLAARPSQREDLGAWYAKVLDVAERENRSVPELAEELGCSRETIYSWRRRLTNNDGQREVSRGVGLVRVQVTEAEARTTCGAIEIRTRGGRSILVHDGFEPSTLAAVVSVLERC